MKSNSHLKVFKSAECFVSTHLLYNCIILFSLLNIFSGCAFLGSRAFIYDKALLTKADNIVIMTLNSEQNVPVNIEIMLDSTFTNTIEKRLSENNYPRVKLLDKFSATNISVTNGNISINNPNYFKKYDAILVFERKLQWPLGMSADTKVEITMYDLNSRKPIMHISHNTTFGNSYWMNPTLPQTLIDATNGAIDKLIKKMDKYR